MKIFDFCFGVLSFCFLNGCILSGKPKKEIPQNPLCLVYDYTSEALGYSDLEFLGNMDSLSTKKIPFFSRAGLQTYEVFVEAKIKKCLISENNSTKLFSVEIIGPKIRFEQNGLDLSLTDSLANEFNDPFFIQVNRNGNIIGIKMPNELNEIGQNLIKDILGDFQFVKSDSSVESWKVTEENSIGTFNSSYKLVKKNKDSLYFQKTNMGFIQFKGQRKGSSISANQFSKVTTNSNYDILDMTHSVSYAILTGKDTSVVSGSKKNIRLISVKRCEENEVYEKLNSESSPSYSEYVNLSRAPSEDEILKKTYRSTLGTDNFENLVTKLNNSEILTEEMKFDLVKKFRALAYLYPTLCPELSKMLAQSTVSSNYHEILLNALASTDTEASLTAIAKALEIRISDEEFCLDLLPFLATAKKPTHEVVSILKHLLENKNISKTVSNTIELSLGGMALNFRDNMVSQSDSLYDYLFNRLRNSTDTIKQLLVIGNTGSPKAIKLLRYYIKEVKCSPDVKEYAIAALRHIRDKEVEMLLKEVVDGPDKKLSEKANEVIKFRKMEENSR